MDSTGHNQRQAKARVLPRRRVLGLAHRLFRQRDKAWFSRFPGLNRFCFAFGFAHRIRAPAFKNSTTFAAGRNSRANVVFPAPFGPPMT